MTPERALALLSARAILLDDEVEVMRAHAAWLPISIQVEVNNLHETLDLLRHKIREQAT